MDPGTFAFVTALMVNFVDTMGLQFTLPVMVPFGRWMGADLQTIALFATARGLMCIVSNMWMPKLSDRRGRKFVIMVSLIGSGIAYAVQGMAGHVDKGPVAVFMAGRAISGFFGGTMPVVRAYVTEVSLPDMQLMKQRMTMLLVANQAAGIALAPIAGAMATFGLTLPFFTCAGVAVFGIGWAICFFKEAGELKAIKQKSTASPDRAPPPEKVTGKASIPSTNTREADPVDAPERKNPWCDHVVICLLFAYISIFLLVSGYILLLPVLLSEASFGLYGATLEETEGNIAKAFGLIAIPNGVCNILVSVFLFVPITKKFGDLKIIITAGIVNSVNFILYGFLPSELWHLCILQAVSGCCFGLMLPALGPLMASYAGVHYPKRMAECQAIPILGMNLSMAVGQNLMALIHEEFSMKAAWIVCGVCVTLFMGFFAMAFILVQRRSHQSQDLNSEQKKVRLEIGGDEIDKFVDGMCAELRQLLLENKTELWNAPIQHVVRKRLTSAVPEIRGWKEETHGREYLEDLCWLLQDSPAELSKLSQLFPDIAMPQSRFEILDVQHGTSGFNIAGFSNRGKQLDTAGSRERAGSGNSGGSAQIVGQKSQTSFQKGIAEI